MLNLVDMEGKRRERAKEDEAKDELERDEKRRKIQELEQAVEEAVKARDEQVRREREAKENLRDALKDQRRLESHFGKRRAATKVEDLTIDESSTVGVRGQEGPVVDLVAIKKERMSTLRASQQSGQAAVIICDSP